MREVDSIGDAEGLRWVDGDALGAVNHFNRPQYLGVLAAGTLPFESCPRDQSDEGQSAAIQYRYFQVVEFNVDVVNVQGCQR